MTIYIFQVSHLMICGKRVNNYLMTLWFSGIYSNNHLMTSYVL